MEADKRLLDQLKHNLGPLIMAALDDPEVVEIMLNPDGKLWLERAGKEMEASGQMTSAQGRLVISLVASALETVVTAANPIVEGELPLNGLRFEGLIPPVVAGPAFTIRKKASRIFSLEDYVANSIMPESLIGEFCAAISKHENILVVGGTGSGKTTLVNAFIHKLSELCPDDRLLVLEDTMELQPNSPNTVMLRTSDYVDMTRLLKATMRLRPTRVLIGEVRDGAALALLKAWNTGHPGGIATVHANSAAESLDRMEELVAEATPAPKQKLIGNAVNKVVFIERAPGGRRISQVLSVKGYDARACQYKTETVYHA